MLYQPALEPGPCLTIPGPGITRREHRQGGRGEGGQTESVMNTDSSQLVTVVAVGHRSQ